MVVAIVGILATMVMPKVRVDNSQVDAAARTINLVMMAAQRDAAARQHNVLVVFDTSAHVIRAVWDVNNNAQVDASEHTRAFVIPERVTLGRPSGVSALAGATSAIPAMNTSARGPYLVLQRNGAVDRSVTLYFSTYRALAGGTDKDSRAVVISRATGRPDWYAWNGTTWRRGL